MSVSEKFDDDNYFECPLCYAVNVEDRAPCANCGQIHCASCLSGDKLCLWCSYETWLLSKAEEANTTSSEHG